MAEPVALVAAPDRALALAARDAVHLRTEPLPAVLDPLEATDFCKTFQIDKGDLDAGFAGADLVVEGTYRTGLPGAALPGTAGDDRHPARRRGHRGPRLAPVPVLRAHGADAGTRAGPGPGRRRPGGDGRRVRRQGGVPLDPRDPCLPPRPQGRAAGADGVRPARGPRRDDQAAPLDHPAPDGCHRDREARGPGHRHRLRCRCLHHGLAGGPVPRRHPRRRAVRLSQRADPRPLRHHQHAAQRRLPRVRRPAVRVRRGDAPGPGRRGPRHVAPGDPPPQRVPRGRHHRHRPGAARERRRARRAGGRGRGIRLRAHLAGSRRGRPSAMARHAPPRGSGSRSAGTGPGSRARARHDSPAWRPWS